jgi:DNA-3-methyladenine glycosylase II
MSQRISMRQSAAIQDRLIAEHGHPVAIAGTTINAFPSPDRLLAVQSIGGLPAEKIERLHSVARAALDGRLDADRLRALGDVDGPESVRSIRGIGPFWSSGIYLRGCGIVDAFPEEPLSIAALGRIHGLGESLDRDTVERLTDPYRPYRMWVCFLLRVAASRELIPGIRGREMSIRNRGRRTAGH